VRVHKRITICCRNPTLGAWQACTKKGESDALPLNGYARLLAAAHEPKGQQSAAHQQGERDECRHGRDGATGRGKGRNGGASGRRAILLNDGLPILLNHGRTILLTHRRD
jgi:hypothetical protein